MKTSQPPGSNEKQSEQVNYFGQLRRQLDGYQRSLAGFLNEKFHRLSTKARRTILIAAGLAMATVCFKLVFVPGEFSFSVGSLKRPALQSSIPVDSVSADSVSSR